MKKIDLIVNKGKGFTEKLFRIKQRQIYRALGEASDNIEAQKEKAVLGYENAMLSLAEIEDMTDAKNKINELLKYKETIMNADKTISVIKEIRTELESEISDEEAEYTKD